MPFLPFTIAILVSAANSSEMAIFDRAAEGDVRPLRVIGGPRTQPLGGIRHGFDVHPGTRIVSRQE
jgi:hypothetical protein